MTVWTNPQRAGHLPQIIINRDARSAQEQVNARYQHGGGWRSVEGFKLGWPRADEYSLNYEGEEPLREVSRALFHGTQVLVLFKYSYLAIVEADKLIDVSRID